MLQNRSAAGLPPVKACKSRPGGISDHIRSDNGPEFTDHVRREWLATVGAKTLYIEPGSPWENGYCESFNSKLRDELLKGEVFYSLNEARVVIESWRRHYNTIRPYSTLAAVHRRQRRSTRSHLSWCWRLRCSKVRQ